MYFPAAAIAASLRAGGHREGNIMFKSGLLISTAMTSVTLLLCGAPIWAYAQTNMHSSHDWSRATLYSQNSNDAGNALDSQAFTSFSGYGFNNQAADDFVIPAGQTWTIGEIDVTGAYFAGSGPATSENVYFYKNHKDLPGTAISGTPFMNVVGKDNDGSFKIVFPKKLRLRAGHYWVSVQANCDQSCGQWGWELSTVVHNGEAAWQQPGCGWSCCPTWETLANCFNPYWIYDFMFDLKS
jgi:hypothetical protein